MERKLYHGSIDIIEKPLFGKGNIFNDYGLGFYCTTIKSLAEEWAGKAGRNSYVNVYFLRDDNLKILDLTKPPYDNVLYWVALLLNNRELNENIRTNYPKELEYIKKHFLIDVSNYDVIIGYRADDSYFEFPLSFVRSEITLKSLEQVFLAGELGKQYVLKSKKAFEKIKFESFYPIKGKERDDYYKRVNNAKNYYKELLNQDRYSKDKKLRDLINEEDN